MCAAIHGLDMADEQPLRSSPGRKGRQRSFSFVRWRVRFVGLEQPELFSSGVGNPKVNDPFGRSVGDSNRTLAVVQNEWIGFQLKPCVERCWPEQGEITVHLRAKRIVAMTFVGAEVAYCFREPQVRQS